MSSSLLMVSFEEASHMREAARRTPPKTLGELAQQAFNAGPWSVTFHRPAGGDAGPNDYFSEALYWWPDPRNPDGPYILRDGEPNPDRFLANARDIQAMSNAILALGAGAFLFGAREYVDRASTILDVWFVAPKTRMNPNLEFGQAVRGRNSGRGRGIIETTALIWGVQGITLLEAAGGLDTGLALGVRQWFADYLQWMTTSAKGRDESCKKNNHATWWTAQVAAFAILTGNVAARRTAWDHYRDFLVPTQIQSDGSCPHEEARPISLSYSAMNLDAFATICRLAQAGGVDLWSFQSRCGAGVARALDYLAPYVLDPASWRKEQKEPFRADKVVFPGLGALGTSSQELLFVYHRLPRALSPWVQFIDLIVRSA
jgi:hypothetical protein